MNKIQISEYVVSIKLDTTKNRTSNWKQGQEKTFKMKQKTQNKTHFEYKRRKNERK